MEAATKQTPLLYLKPMPQYAHGKKIMRFHCVIGEVRLGYSTDTGSYDLFSESKQHGISKADESKSSICPTGPRQEAKSSPACHDFQILISPSQTVLE